MRLRFKGKKKTPILLLALLVTGAGALHGYREYYRTNKDIADVDPVYLIADTALIHSYLSNEQSANKQYLGKIVTLRGYIKELKGAGGASLTLALGSSPDGSFVSCAVDPAHRAEFDSLATGDAVFLKGLVIGFNKDETGLLGSEVQLTHCMLDTSQKK